MYAFKSYVGEIIEADKDGTIYTYESEIPYKKGDLIFVDLNGNKKIIKKDDLSNMVEVKLLKRINKKVKSPFIEQYEKQLIETNKDEEYRKALIEFGSLDKIDKNK